jgi:uncharacterized membrane protein YoaK (UPF0700 family)
MDDLERYSLEAEHESEANMQFVAWFVLFTVFIVGAVCGIIGHIVYNLIL